MESTNFTLSRLILSLLRMSVPKTLYVSLRCQGLVIVGHKSRVRLERGSRLKIAKGGLLTVGIKYNGPSRAWIEVKRGGTFRVEGRAHLMRGTSVEIAHDAILSIGDDTFLNENTKIVCNTRISIGNHCAISWGNTIIDSDMHYLIKSNVKQEKMSPVRIGNHVWTGMNVTVLKGVTIGDHSVVAAGSIVTRSIPESTLSAGVPSHVMCSDISWSN
jgi:acetyltransferase-like isoleucine patch superfamily enzyme